MTDVLRFLLVIVLPLCGLSAAPQDDKETLATLSEDQRAAFEILDRFYKPETSKLPLVKVATGNWIQYLGKPEKPKENTYRYGFLLKSEGRRFTVRFLHCGQETFEITRKGTPEHSRVGFKPVEIRTYVAEVLKRIDGWAERTRQDGDRGIWDFYVDPCTPMNPTALTVALSQACARRGRVKEAAKLWDALKQERPPPTTIWSKLGDAIVNRIYMDFAEQSLTWQELLTKHLAWLEAFPGHSYQDLVREQKAALERLIQEQAKRAATSRPSKPSGQDARIAELIYQLRNDFHPVKEYPADGWFLPPRGSAPKKEFGAAKELREIGVPAIPALLDAMEDKALTRTVWYSSRYGGGFIVHTVRSKAYDLICQITGQDLNMPPPRKRVLAWYEAEMKRRGGDAGLFWYYATGGAVLLIIVVAAFARYGASRSACDIFKTQPKAPSPVP